VRSNNDVNWIRNIISKAEIMFSETTCRTEQCNHYTYLVQLASYASFHFVATEDSVLLGYKVASKVNFLPAALWPWGRLGL
jgi:hypothetical protein